MRPDFVVIRGVRFQNAAQVDLAEHNEVVERFAANRSDDALCMAVLPRRARCRRMIADPACGELRFSSEFCNSPHTAALRLYPGSPGAPGRRFYLLPATGSASTCDRTEGKAGL